VRHVVIQTDIGPDTAVVDDLRRAGAATVHEAMGRTGSLGTHLRPVFPGVRIAGRAVTVLTQAGDNLMIHAAIEQCRPGDVLVVATVSLCTDGMIGELIATALRARGVVGCVIDAGVRDVADITALAFPIWSRAISLQGTVKATAGSVNVPVVVGSQSVSPGDVVVADDDGVVAVPLAAAKEVAASSLARVAAEDRTREAYTQGVLSLDAMRLRSELQRLGVEYVDDRSASTPPAAAAAVPLPGPGFGAADA
jgi:4-hydroxy-4-methyl-2-oxoglutarate aldolase